MSAMVSQITGVSIVCSTVYSGADQRKHQSSASLAFVTGGFPSQTASYAENVFIWWRHHIKQDLLGLPEKTLAYETLFYIFYI